MCGIFCSNDLTTFEILEEANRERGNFATGIFYCYGKVNSHTLRREGKIDWDKIKMPKGDGWLFLGHNQAPTQTGRRFSESTSHPFQYGDWIVAHNGIISNFEELIKDEVPMHNDAVDSSIIPAILYRNDLSYGPCVLKVQEIENILYTLEKLEGTFALWMVNLRTMNIYIARQGSTLFYKGANISSVKGKGYREVKEGVLYSYSNKGLKKVETFTNKSPFLTL